MADQIQLPVAGGDLHPQSVPEDVEFGTGVMAVHQRVAVGDVDGELGDVALLLLVPGEQIRHVRLVLDEHHLGEVPDDGTGGGEVFVGRVATEHIAHLVHIRFGQPRILVLQQVVNPQREVELQILGQLAHALHRALNQFLELVGMRPAEHPRLAEDLALVGDQVQPGFGLGLFRQGPRLQRQLRPMLNAFRFFR